MSGAVLGRWTRGLAVIARVAPPRLTTPQLSVFALVALCDFAGRPTTMTAVRDTLGPMTRGSVKTTYAIFLEPTATQPGRLGWIRQVASPMDSRARLLHLTPKGRLIVKELLAAVGSL